MLQFALIFVSLITRCTFGATSQYEPNWSSLDTRPLPPWYDEAKIGIFLHWGLYSVPSFGSEWFWANWQSGKKRYVDFMTENYRPGFTYQDFGPLFTAEFFDSNQWAELFQAAGARYVVLTSKHHEGFTMWPSRFSWGWNSMDLGPRRDLIEELSRSVRNKTPDIHFGLYYSLYDWFHPLYLSDKSNGFTTDSYVRGKSLPELVEMTEMYEPEIIWTDGDWEAEDSYWRSTEFLAWLFNESPVKGSVVVNDRWGIGIPCQHGSFYTCTDRYNPGVLQPHKWENCMTLDKSSWGYNRLSKAEDYLSIEDLLATMIKTISCGGNLLVNTGPTHDGRIDPIMEERLRQMGQWLSLNGEAIYASTPWIYQNDTITPSVWYTRHGTTVYATILEWPESEVLNLGAVNSNTTETTATAHLLNYPLQLQSVAKPQGLRVFLPPLSRVKGKWAWVLRFEGLKGE